MRLANQVSYLILALVVAMLLAIVVPIEAKTIEPSKELPAQCWSIEFQDMYCKLRAIDNKIWWNEKWHKGYVVTGDVVVDGELRLIIEKEK